jgi:hypothetical protein
MAEQGEGSNLDFNLDIDLYRKRVRSYIDLASILHCIKKLICHLLLLSNFVFKTTF